MCSLDDILNLPVSLRPKMATWVVVWAPQERVAHALASRKDKGCADLPLPSCAINFSPQRSDHCFNQCGFCGERKCPGSRLQADESVQDGRA